MYLSRS